MSRPRLLSSVPQEPWDPARDPGDITREPWDPAREPWDIGWLLREDQQEGPRGSRAQPPLSWGSPIVTQDTLLNHHHHLQGTWSQEPADTEGEDLGARGELAQEVEQPRQHTVPAFRGRSLGQVCGPAKAHQEDQRETRIQDSTGALDVCPSIIPSPVFTCRVVEANISVRGNRVEADTRLSSQPPLVGMTNSTSRGTTSLQ